MFLLVLRQSCKKAVTYCKLNRLQQQITCSFSSSSSVEDADIVISGGGMVGGAMACALAHNDLFSKKKIIMLESSPDRDAFHLQEKFSNRTCALSPATVTLLDGLGVWNEILQLRCHPVKRMQVWESCSESLITFNNEELTNSLAYIVENDVILAAIMKRLKAANVVDIRYNSQAKSFVIPTRGDSSSKRNSWVGLELANGDVLQTKLLIGADGMQSAVRRASKFHTLERDYKQSAVVATLKLSEMTDNTVAWQRFLPTGPIALLPLSDSVSSLIWTTSHENAKHLQSIPEDSFVDAVNDALWHERDQNQAINQALLTFSRAVQNVIPGGGSAKQLPPTVVGIETGSRAAFPLKLIHSSQYVRPRVALIGDAAHRLHPLAGQGVNLGFGDVVCLNKVLTAAAKNGSDPGSLTPLLDYETERQRHVLPVLATIDSLQRLYSTSFAPIVMIRSLGLQATNSLDFVKKMVIQQAST
ncbi:ubiquinone biosynthesis monooxygenase COQ6, mitochondrial-like isoform X2 [Gigantopelta aegis]|uniref:ubiquinone biosynthesis monooxygenase COQ6, mitochondrial-like isoform X2 n=1 Tax=Gigantopelta aegis TaxID=1735272 RepID=UPI001B88CB87|nr:ubiquinone biosynthesis monooxygenase COQ6, mitochondrial-like isoform X2 [Gigantopelta aegis]